MPKQGNKNRAAIGDLVNLEMDGREFEGTVKAIDVTDQALVVCGGNGWEFETSARVCDLIPVSIEL